MTVIVCRYIVYGGLLIFGIFLGQGFGFSLDSCVSAFPAALLFCCSCFCAFPASLLFCFSVFLLLAFPVSLLLFFSCSLLFCFSAFPASLLFCFFASLLLLLLCFYCFSAFPASLPFGFSALCFPCFFAFPASLLFCYCAAAPFYLYYSTFSFVQICVFAAPLPAPLLLCFLSLLSICFSCSFAFFFPVCILNEDRDPR